MNLDGTRRSTDLNYPGAKSLRQPLLLEEAFVTLPQTRNSPKLMSLVSTSTHQWPNRTPPSNGVCDLLGNPIAFDFFWPERSRQGRHIETLVKKSLLYRLR